MLNISLISSSFWHVKIVHFLCSNFQVFAGIFTRCPTCQRAHIYHFCSFCIRCHICHFPIAIWSQNLGIGTIFEPNLPLKTGCNKFQMESVKMKKATKTVAFRQLAIYCNIVDNQLLTDAAYRTTWMWKSCVLNGRKVFSRLFFRSKTVRFAALFTWIRTNGKTSFSRPKSTCFLSIAKVRK